MQKDTQQVDGLASHLTQELGAWQPIETAPKDGTAVLLCWAVDADKKMIDWQKEPKTADVFVQVASWCRYALVRYVRCSLSSKGR